jgi:hypothetical protein
VSIDYGSLKKLAEGKTKIIYENPEDEKTVYMGNTTSSKERPWLIGKLIGTFLSSSIVRVFERIMFVVLRKKLFS